MLLNLCERSKPADHRNKIADFSMKAAENRVEMVGVRLKQPMLKTVDFHKISLMTYDVS